nr:hypothetical protein [Paenibacillus xylanexedens]
MAKLAGIMYLDSGEAIKWDGAVYGRTADVPEPGDIAFDGADYFEVIPDRSGLREDDAYDRVSIIREYGEAFVRKSHVIFRKCADNTADYLATKRTQLATLTAEIAELEAQLAEESRLKVGDYARVNDGAEVGRFAPGDVVVVSESARAESAIYPIGVISPVLGYAAYEAYKAEHLTKVTPEEARASLIAKIDAHFNEGGAESRE